MLATGLAILAMASATTQTTPFVPINLGTITLEQQLCMAQELFAIQFERLGSHYKQLFPTGITGSFTITAARDDLLGRAMFEPGVNQIDINAMALLVSKLGLLPSGHAVNQAAAGDLLLPWGAQYLFGEVHRSIVTHNPELELYMSLVSVCVDGVVHRSILTTGTCNSTFAAAAAVAGGSSVIVWLAATAWRTTAVVMTLFGSGSSSSLQCTGHNSTESTHGHSLNHLRHLRS